MKKNTILITGATSGIGFATAHYFAQLGYSVFFTGRDNNKIDEVELALKRAFTHSEQQVKGFKCDNRSQEDIKTLSDFFQKQAVKLDCLILNAGAVFPCEFHELSVESLNAVMETNFTGPLFTLQSLVTHLQNPASVIYVSSIAVERAFSASVGYTASKAAFEGAARVLNLELAKLGIRVNTLRLGYTRTALQEKLGMSPEDIKGLEAHVSDLPLTRLMLPEDLQGCFKLLASDQSLAMRNSVITIDGGYCL